MNRVAYLKRDKRGYLDRSIPVLFLIPVLSILVLLLGFPIISSLFYAFTNKNLIFPKTRMVGLKNFSTILMDRDFWNAFYNSIRFTSVAVSTQFLLGFVAALCLNKIRRLKGLFRTLCIIPWTCPNIVIAFTWTWILNDLYGPINAILKQFGAISEPILFFGTPKLAFFSIIMITTWFGFPFMMVNILAGLQSISKSEYEAAAIDGASSIQVFTHITLPHLKHIIGLLISLRVIWIFNNFDLIFLLTGGGPSNSTETLPLYAHRMGWGMNQLGLSAAVSVILFIFLMIIISIYLHFISRIEGQNENEAL